MCLPAALFYARPGAAATLPGSEEGAVRLTRMYRGADGVSHFEDREVPARQTRVGAISSWFPGGEMLFRTVPQGLFLDWHAADDRVLIVILRGRIEVTVGHGVTRRFGPGAIVLAEDLDGPGHQTRDVEGPRESLMIKVPPDFSVETWRRLGTEAATRDAEAGER